MEKSIKITRNLDKDIVSFRFDTEGEFKTGDMIPMLVIGIKAAAEHEGFKGDDALLADFVHKLISTVPDEVPLH